MAQPKREALSDLSSCLRLHSPLARSILFSTTRPVVLSTLQQLQSAIPRHSGDIQDLHFQCTRLEFAYDGDIRGIGPDF